MKTTNTPWYHSNRMQLHFLSEGETINEIPHGLLPHVDQYLAFCRETGGQPSTRFASHNGEWLIRRFAEGHLAETSIHGNDGPLVEFLMARQDASPCHWQYCRNRCEHLHQQGMVQNPGTELPHPVEGPWVGVITYKSYWALNDALLGTATALIVALAQTYFEEELYEL